MDFPVTLEVLLTVPGIAVLSAVLILWLNAYIPESKKLYTNLIALALCEALAFLACFIVHHWQPTPEALCVTFLVGLFGTSLECYGYEAIKNKIAFGNPGT